MRYAVTADWRDKKEKINLRRQRARITVQQQGLDNFLASLD
jgi:hypothetical protein